MRNLATVALVLAAFGIASASAQHQAGKRVVLVYPLDKWILRLLEAGAKVRNLGDVRWCATEDGSAGPGSGRHIACFILAGPLSENLVKW